VYIDRTKDDYRNIDRTVTITGTKEQIEVAKVSTSGYAKIEAIDIYHMIK
jgi:hypothetical protein